MVIHTMILSHTHLHKILPDAHHTHLHTHTIIHIKILMRQPVGHTIKYYVYKKLSQSPHLPEIHHGMEKLGMARASRMRIRP